MDIYIVILFLDFRGSDLNDNHLSLKNEKVYDYIVGSDITYIIDTFDDLIKSLLSLSHSSTEIYISHELRKQSELEFYHKATKAGLNIHKVFYL